MKKQFVWVFAMIVLNAPAQSLYQQTKTFSFNLSDPDTAVAINIRNRKAEATEFFFRFNGNFFQNTGEILDHISKTYHKTDPDAVYNFVTGNIIHQNPINNSASLNNPLIQLNSLGMGLCSQKAFLMSIICTKFGYNSKPVYLKNHVICFAENNGRKELYDTDYNIILRNKDNGSVLTVDSLYSFKFNDYIIPDSSGFKSYTKYYSDQYRNSYKQSTYPDSLKYFNLDEFHITVPEGSDLSFPVSIPDDSSLNNINYAFALLTVPPKFSGRISNPLILFRVTGKCNVFIGDDKYVLPYNENILQERLASCNVNVDIQIRDAQSEVKLYYFINNSFLKFNNVNRLDVFINDSNAIEIKLVPVSFKTVPFTYKYVDVYMPEIKKELKRIKTRFPEINKTNLKSVDEMASLALKTGLIKKKEVISFTAKMNILVKISGYSFSEISSFIQYVESFVAYTVSISSMSNSEIIVFSGYLKNSRRKK